MDAWETFTVEAETGGKVAIKTHFGYYLSAQKDGRLQADRSSVGDWERFTPECLGNYQTNTYIVYHSVLNKIFIQNELEGNLHDMIYFRYQK